MMDRVGRRADMEVLVALSGGLISAAGVVGFGATLLLGASESRFTNVIFVFALGGVIGIYLMAWMSTRWKLSNLIFVLSVSSAIGMVIFAYAPNELNLLMILILLIGILQQGGFTGLYGAASKVYPTEIRSTGIGWAIGLGRSGAVAGPTIAGYLIVAGFDMDVNDPDSPRVGCLPRPASTPVTHDHP